MQVLVVRCGRDVRMADMTRLRQLRRMSNIPAPMLHD